MKTLESQDEPKEYTTSEQTDDMQSTHLESPQVAQVWKALDRGDFHNARLMLKHATSSLDLKALSESDQMLLDKARERLRFDPAEFILPLILLGGWAILFWRTLH